MIPCGIRSYRKYKLKPLVESAYMNLRRVVEPGTLNPERPGNPVFMRSDSRDEINLLRPKLIRVKYLTPDSMNLSEESAQEWFWFLGQVRVDI